MEGPVVKIKSGKIKGIKRKSAENYELYCFLGIPYAKPPVGELRFKDPEPIESWDGIKDCTKFGSISAQITFHTSVFEGTDDCLYLNVYTKTYDNSALQPVMVWIHGGGFITGSGNDDLYGPDYLLKKNVVLVTINYRLNVFGFLNLEDEVAPGNQGLKDQVVALQWVRDNIVNFGGDPKNVTIFGESAGGAAVHYLTLSPLAKGLFDKAICQSGVANAAWASIENPKKYAIRLAKVLGHNSEDPASIVQFLRTVECSSLVEAQKKIKTAEERVQGIMCFGPGVDNKSSRPFLPRPVDEMVKQGVDVPLLIGHTSREGLFLLPNPYDPLPLEDRALSWFKVEYFDEIHKNFENHIHPKILGILNKHKVKVSDFRHMYFKNEPISKENQGVFADLMGDMFFVMPIHETAKLQVDKNSPTYMYVFGYDKGFSIVKTILNTSLPGAAHVDDLFYLFFMSFFDPVSKKSQKDRKIMEHMVEIWTSFAKSGNPTITTSNICDWTQLKDDGYLNVLNIGENLQLQTVPYYQERFAHV